MQYFKIEPGKFIEFNEETNQARIIVKADLIVKKHDLLTRIALNPVPTNAELLAWAKQNYPFVNHSKEQEELDKILATLEAIKAI